MNKVLVLYALSFALLPRAAEALPGTPTDTSATAFATAPRFNVDSATRSYLAQLPPDKKRASDNYFEGGYWLYLWGFLYNGAIMLFLLTRRVSARMRDLAMRLTPRPNLQTATYFIQFLVLVALLQFPLTFYQDFVREHTYGLATQAFGPWVRDLLVSLSVGLVLGTLAIVALFALVRRLNRSWWMWGAAAAVTFIAIGLIILPVFLLPLFNKYTPLESGPVRDAVVSMARANGIPVSHVYVMDASQQTTRISANVSGFLGTERITLNDNLLKRCSLAEIKFVMGHEMGHYVLNHDYYMLLFLTVLAFIFFAWLDWSMRAVLRRWGERWRISGLGDPAVLPLAILMFSILRFAMTPIGNSFSRSQEYEADMFGLNASGQPDGFAQVALKFADYRKLEPGKWEEIMFYDHPSGRTRIYTAMRWKAEHLEELPSGHAGNN